MPRLDVTVDIEDDPESVWEYISRPERYPEWMEHGETMLSVEEPMNEGATYRIRGGFTPRKSDSEWRIESWEPPRWQHHRKDGGTIQPLLTIELEPDRGKTRLHLSSEFEFLPQFPRVGWWLEVVFVRQLIHVLVGWPMKASLRTTAKNVKRAVESREQESG